jgi:hypothetical protein
VRRLSRHISLLEPVADVTEAAQASAASVHAADETDEVVLLDR